MWVFNAVPGKMLMVYTMVFGAHLLPYAWLYRSKSYVVFSMVIPILALFLGHLYSPTILAMVMTALEILFVILLYIETKHDYFIKS